jgi:selenocysteine lyase/cysteine desulfurase
MSSALDVARRETPGCERVLHLNNAGAALLPTPVINAVTAHLEREALIGGYEAADEVESSVERVYDSAARLLGCARDDIAVIENATRVTRNSLSQPLLFQTSCIQSLRETTISAVLS